jgi:hypothetical protein
MTSEECRVRLEPYHAGIYWCIADGHARTRKALADLKIQRPDPSFVSHLRQQMIVDGARGYFSGEPDAEVIDRCARRRNLDPDDVVSDRFVVRIGKPGADAMICLFKKFNSEFETRNYPTRTAIRYNRQLPLESIPVGFRFNAGYQVDESGALTSVAIACPGKMGTNWWYELEPAEESGGEAVSGSPLQPARVRVKETQLDIAGLKGGGSKK